MTAYLVMIGILIGIALFESSERKNLIAGKISCVLLVLFGGLRYETGFDWVSYEQYYEFTNPFWSIIPQYVEPNLLVEPGFALFNLMCKSLGLSFQSFTFLVTLINMTIIFLVAKKFTNRVALVFLVYFGFAFLAAQMAAIRQSLSYSFLLLALIKKQDHRWLASYVFSAIAVSIHTFSIIFIPLIYLKIKPPPFPVVLIFVAGGLVTSYYGVNPILLITDNLLPLLGSGLVTTKLQLYGNFEGASVSIASLAFIPLHLAVYYLLKTNRFPLVAKDTELSKFTIYIVILILFAHSYFSLFPAFWNRVSYLAFLLESVALTARYAVYFRNPVLPLATTGFSGAASVAITVYTLSSPSSLPFTPYQNVAIVWITGNTGDGRSRYAYAFDLAERQYAEQKR